MALTSVQGYKMPAGGPPPGAQGEGESADFKMTDLDAHKKELIMQAVQEAIKGKREDAWPVFPLDAWPSPQSCASFTSSETDPAEQTC